LNKKSDQFYMQRCLYLAEKGLGNTYPNPLVGAVLVYKNRIIGEAWHKKAGEAHAEINAINSVQDKSLLSKSTLYVNLEPCSHHGKTPPCILSIKKHKIPKVVIGSVDPNPKVAGRGIEALESWGCEVQTGILKKEADYLNRRFFIFHRKKRPYIILKWAQTQDKFIAPKQEHRRASEVFWISNQYARQKTHLWRKEEEAILIGVQTLIDDNPRLTLRHWDGKNPTRLILDPNNRASKNSTIFKDNEVAYFFNSNKNDVSNELKKFILLKPFGIEALLNFCYDNELQSIIVEGGKKTLDSFIDSNLWDEARVITAQKKLHQGIKAPRLDNEIVVSENIKSNQLDYYFN